jgi:glycosyltransferase involved in cell wall biosynthesis
MNSLVSIIVPCYKQAQYLGVCLESVLSQSYSNWECIIVNDGSPDETKEVANKWCLKDSRFHYLEKENGGLSSARNAGIKLSTGKYILPLDADDYISKDYIQQALTIFQNNENIKLIYGKAELFCLQTGEWVLPKYTYPKLLEGNMINCSAIYKRTDYNQTLGYDEQLKTGYEDWDFWLQLLSESDEIHFIADFTVFYYRIKEVSMLKDIDLEHAKKLRLYIYNKHKLLFEKYWNDPILLKRENTDLLTHYKNSTSYKVGVFITYPIRKLKDLFY